MQEDIQGNVRRKKTINKKEVIKNILIVFLLIMLILVFFSNTIMNRSLPEVSSERAISGKLTERIRGSGLVQSNQSYDVTVDGNKTVDEVKIKAGKKVKKGDVLFTVTGEESQELSTMEDTLSAMELEYQKLLIALPADYTVENQAVNSAKSDLSAAIAKRDEAVANESYYNSLKANYNNNKAELSRLTREQTKLQTAISAIDMDEYSMASPEYTGDIIELKNAYDDAEAECLNAQAELDKLTQSQFVSRYTETVSDREGVTETDESGESTTDYKSTTDYNSNNVYDNSAEIEEAERVLEEAESARDEAKSEYEDAKYSLRSELAQELSDTEEDIDYYTILVSDYESSSANMQGMTIDDLNLDVQAKQRALEEAIANLDKSKLTGENQDKLNDLDADAKKKDIDRLKERIDKLKEKTEDGEVLSKYDGVVSAVNIKSGETTVPDMPLAVIDITENGYTAEITVDGEQAKKVRKGVKAEIMNNWDGDAEAVLTDIKNDTTAGSKNRILTFSVTGDVDSGTYLELSIPCGSGSYDTIVPKSAVHEDSNGKFVLTMKSKSSPLGNRYYAQRVDVEVLVSDELSSAVQGNIYSGDYVITASSEPVSAGNQVRMRDSG